MLNPRHTSMAAALSAALALGAVTAPATASDTVRPNSFWWPEQLDLGPLRDHDRASNPYGEDFDYAAEFAQLDLAALKADLREVMTTSQGLVAGRLGPLRAAVHPHGLAQRRHLPHL